MTENSKHPSQHPLFKERAFDAARRSVIDLCNNIPFETRWEQETPVFAQAILRHVMPEDKRLLDYGTGVGRLAKAILERQPNIEILGVDDSPVQLEHARRYVNNPRFQPILPQQCHNQVNLVYCVYVLQHIPAISLREALSRMHYWLRPGGTFIVCTSYSRMAPRFDNCCSFFDDGILGVAIRAEIERLFEPQGDLFLPEELQQNDIVRRMVIGDDGRPAPLADGSFGLAHPAIVYRRREISGPYFDVPMPAWHIARE